MKWAVKYDYCQGRSDVQATQIIRRSHLTHIPLTHQLRILCIMLLLVLVQQQRRIKGWLHARIVAGHGILRKIIIVRVRVEQVRIIRVMMSPRLIQLILKRRPNEEAN